MEPPSSFKAHLLIALTLACSATAGANDENTPQPETRDARQVIGQVTVGPSFPTNALNSPALTLSGGAGLVLSRSQNLTLMAGLHEFIAFSGSRSGTTTSFLTQAYQGPELMFRRIAGTGLYASVRLGIGVDLLSTSSGSTLTRSSTSLFLYSGPAVGYDLRLTGSLDLNFEVYFPVAFAGLTASTSSGLLTFAPYGMLAATVGLRFYL